MSNGQAPTDPAVSAGRAGAGAPQRPSHSLRRRLLWLLAAAVLATALVQGAIAYRTARAEADDIFDYHMQQIALSLRSSLPVQDLDDDVGVDFSVQIWTENGLRIFRSPHAELPQRAVLGFTDVRVGGKQYRLFSLAARDRVIQVAQDMAVRRRMAGTLALRTVLPTAAMAPLLMLLVWWAVGSSLAPLRRVREQVAQRQPDDLSEVSEAGEDGELPDEVRPLVRELNLLLGRVRRAFDMQARFVADAAHELRTPLAALKLQAQNLQRAQGAGDDGARQLAIARLSAGIDRASRLVEQLLVLARQQAAQPLDGSAGGQTPEGALSKEAGATGTGPQAGAIGPAPSLAELARAELADLAPLAQARHIALGLDVAPAAEHAVAPGPPEALRILLRNLVDNAIKYTPEGGTLEVAVRLTGAPSALGAPGAASGGQLLLTVDDSGPGIPEDQRERVFDRFYRLPGTAEATGSGLGLAIVKSIAEQAAAQISLARSPGLGGLRVAVAFPLPG